jgi:hypothetical protein
MITRLLTPKGLLTRQVRFGRIRDYLRETKLAKKWKEAPENIRRTRKMMISRFWIFKSEFRIFFKYKIFHLELSKNSCRMIYLISASGHFQGSPLFNSHSDSAQKVRFYN